jgi:transposase
LIGNWRQEEVTLYRAHLTPEQQAELNRRARARGVMPRTRDRLEMVRLSGAGWSIPRIAGHLQVSEVRVRYWIKRYLAAGFDALPDAPHPGRQSALTAAMLAAIRHEIRTAGKTWTAAQVAEWVQKQFGLRLTADHLSRMLGRGHLSYKRTHRSLRHKQDAERVAAKRAELRELQKRGIRSD